MELWVRCVIYQAKAHVPKRNISLLKLLCHLNTSLSFLNLFLISAVYFCLVFCQIRSSVSLPSIFCFSCKVSLHNFPRFIFKYDFNAQSLETPCWENKKQLFEALGCASLRLNCLLIREQDYWMATRE